jgi:hypothetical protein
LNGSVSIIGLHHIYSVKDESRQDYGKEGNDEQDGLFTLKEFPYASQKHKMT